jgi:colanic acid/amylovoran biosynthesis protein
VLPLIYSDKTRHVLEDLGFKETTVDIRSHTDFSEMELPNDTACHIQSLVQESQKHFEKLDEIFK